MGLANTAFHNATEKFLFAAFSLTSLLAIPVVAQSVHRTSPEESFASGRPKLVIVIVVDQMRADYIDKFQHQWTGGLKRLVNEGAWFTEAAYPYAETETCVGHSTISTGAFPATHGIVANEWWDRDTQKRVTCTADPAVKNIPFGSPEAAAEPPSSAQSLDTPGDSAAKLLLPSFAEELKFQSSSGTRIVTMSLKARASITLAGHQADAVAWFDSSSGVWQTSTAYPKAAIFDDYAKEHPVAADYGKTWAPLLPASSYLYDQVAEGAGSPAGYGSSFPHPLRGAPDSKGPDRAFYNQWATSPYAETYLALMAANAVDALKLGKGSATDFLGISFSSVDYVGHSFGPRSWEIQDELARLDRDLANLFSHLDKFVGTKNYLVAFSSDHGVAPIPEDLARKGIDAGRLNEREIELRLEKALEPLGFPKPSVVDVGGANVYFAPGVYAKLKSDPHALQAVLDAITVHRGLRTFSNPRKSLIGRPPRILFALPKALVSTNPEAVICLLFRSLTGFGTTSTPGKPVRGGTSHGTPHFYDRRVPVILMGSGIRPGKYRDSVTPADIAPTLAELCGITLATADGRPLRQALEPASLSPSTSRIHAPLPSGPTASAPH